MPSPRKRDTKIIAFTARSYIISSMAYDTELAFAMDLARRAGLLMLTGFKAEKSTEWKEDNTPVTQTDKDVNALVIQQVQAVFPDHGVLGEEASFATDRNKLWVVDPIDGTQAFDLGAPLSTFCLGLVEDGQVKVGVIYDPFQDRMYTAVQGQGAFLNGQKIRVSDSDSLAQNYAVLSSRSIDGYKTTGELYDAIVIQKGKVFNFRSIVYGYMRVATGDAVVAVAGTIKPWDYAAAKVILEEAGATITDFAGRACEYDQINNGIIVSNGRVHEQVLALVQPATEAR